MSLTKDNNLKQKLKIATDGLWTLFSALSFIILLPALGFYFALIDFKESYKDLSIIYPVLFSFLTSFLICLVSALIKLAAQLNRQFNTTITAFLKNKPLVRFLFAFPAIAALILVYPLLFNSGPPIATAGWWNDNWSYRKAIVINSDYVTGDLTDFPVLISLTDTNLGTHAQADGDDIVFISDNGQKLSHEIESFATSTGVLVAWVKIPSLSSTDDTPISMYYGNAAIGNQEDVTNVWDENYVGVWHMNNEETASTTDSTSYDHDGTTYIGSSDVTATTSGKIDGGLGFRAGSGRIGISTSTILDNMQYKTIETWIKVPDQGAHGMIIEKYDDDGNNYGWRLRLRTDETIRFRHTFSTTAGYWSYDTSLTIGKWYHVALSYDHASTAPYLYIDGSIVALNEVAAPDGEHSDDYLYPVNIANSENSAQDFEGVMGEMRLSNAIRSASWIETSHNNQNSPASFLSVQSEESGPGPVGYWTFDEGYGTTANDESGQGNDGTITGAVWQDESMCVSGKCLYFDGTDDYVDISPDVAINAADDEKFTWSLWVKYFELYDRQITMTATDNDGFGDGQTVGEFNIGLNGGDCGWSHGDGGASDRVNINIATSSDWQHWVGVQDGNVERFYINGVLRGETSPGGDPSYLNPTSLRIGRPWANERYFNGFIDEVKIYPYARTADEIRQDYAAGKAGIKSSHGVSASFGSQSDSWLSDGLVGYWQLDESATTSGAVDLSGNGNDGTYYGHASTTAGKFGNGGVFDGDADKINLTNEFNLETTDHSIAAWFRNTGDDTWDIIIKQGHNAETHGWVLHIGYNDGYPRFVHASDGDNVTLWDNTQALDDSTWHHVVVTVDIISKYAVMYVDGEQADTDTFTGSLLHHSQIPLIGGDEGTNYEFNGQIDEVRIYNRALSPREVKKLYEWAPGPVAHWKFDEQSGDTAYDSVASSSVYQYVGGNNGTLTNSPTWTQGKYGGGLRFASDRHVALPKYLVAGMGAISISAWVKADEADTATIAIINQTVSSPDTINLERQANETFEFGVRNDDQTYQSAESAAFQDTNWHHLVGRYDGAEVDLFVDGILVNSSDPLSGVIETTPAQGLTIGSPYDSSNWNGMIDDVRIYNYALSQKQILEVMAGGSGDGQSNQALKQPVLDLSFDTGYGGTAYDASIHKNHGTLYHGGTGDNDATSSMWDLNGKFGRAMEFDSSDDTLNIGSPTATDNLSTLSISAWVYPRSDGETGLGRIVDNQRWGLAISDSGATNALTFYNETNGTELKVVAVDNSWILNNWNHVAVTWNGGQDASTDAKLYIDGKEVSYQTQQDATGTFDTDENNNVSVGEGDGLTFDGLIDEVKIYNYALTEDEIKTLYNRGAAAVMGGNQTAVSNGTTVTGAASEYCIPGDTATCTPPVLELRFDEQTGTTTYDKSGNGNHGVFVSQATSPRWDRGKIGTALRFDGSDDYVEINDLDVNQITISTWINADTVTADQRIVSKWSEAYLLSTDDAQSNEFSFAVTDGSSNNDICDSNINGVYSTGEWVHVTGTYNGSVCKIFVNGIDRTDLQVDFANGNIQNTPEITTIAKESSSDINYFNGLIDHVKIYNYARTPAQIAWDYNRGKPLAHWDFNECKGGTIYDESYRCKEGAGCNHGTLNLGGSGTTATGTCASSSSSTFWGAGTAKRGRGAGSFDGDDDVVKVTDNDIFKPSNITLSAWMKLDTIADDWIISKQVAAINFDYGYLMRLNSPANTVVCVFGYGIDNTNSYYAVTAGSWQHIVCSHDGTNANLYIDGELKNSVSAQAIDYTGVGDLGIGAYNSGARSTDGLIDEVKIWNYALTAEQVRTEYNGGAVRFGN